MKITKDNKHAVDGLSKEMQNIINEYPYSPYNNARKIVRGQLMRLVELSKKQMKKAAWLAQAIWGLDLDYIAGQDDGESKVPRYQNEDSIVVESVDSDEAF